MTKKRCGWVEGKEDIYIRYLQLPRSIEVVDCELFSQSTG